MADCSHETIEMLFFKQIKDLTEKTKIRSFDYQFGDLWNMR